MKQAGIGLKNYMNYQNEIKNQTQAKRKAGELDEKQNLKIKDKIQVLLDSNYSDKEKSAIYEKYIKSSSKENSTDEFSIVKVSNMDINQYLKYKQQEFTSDKEDDGTAKGKTITGSKQEKVVKYLNSMNITGNQRLLLYAYNGYTTSKTEKQQLIKYINSIGLSKDEKVELYEKFSGFTVYKDGRVTYK